MHRTQYTRTNHSSQQQT